MRDRTAFLEQLSAARREQCFPDDLRAKTQQLTDSVLSLLFPHFAEARDCKADRTADDLSWAESALATIAKSLDHDESVATRFIDRLPNVWEALKEDARALFEADPAARSVDEVILAYPGFHATACHRIAHILFEQKLPIVPRLIAELAHERTGVDIHPGASIGRRFMIDHGTGVVVGETAIIGNGVKLFQGVTLGALSVDKRGANMKRHPTIEDHVVIYSNATILGGDTIIGHDSIIAGNAFITQSVPAFSVVNRRGDAKGRESDQDDIIDFSI
jgi:serine O-acetyltransferase